MATDVLMPRLSDSMEEGTILKWLVEEGGEVRRGEPLVEIETDKANVTYDADADGTLVEVVAREGATLPVGGLIARLGAKPKAAENGGGRAASAGRAAGGGRAASAGRAAGGGRAASAGREAGAASAAPDERREAGAKGEVEIQELTRLQQTVARRMAESKATAPDFTLTVDVDMTLAVELRERLKDEAEEPPSCDDMVVKAVATALREHARVNGAYRDGKFELYSRVNIGITLAGRHAFQVPTIFDADRKSLGQIAREVREAAAKVEAGTLTPPELAGGTFTIASLGAFGIDEFTAIITPPQAALLTVGSLRKRPAVDEHGRVVAREQLRLSLVADQRIVYGAEAAEFLARVRRLLEQPLALAL